MPKHQSQEGIPNLNEVPSSACMVVNLILILSHNSFLYGLYNIIDFGLSLWYWRYQSSFYKPNLKEYGK